MYGSLPESGETCLEGENSHAVRCTDMLCQRLDANPATGFDAVSLAAMPRCSIAAAARHTKAACFTFIYTFPVYMNTV